MSDGKTVLATSGTFGSVKLCGCNTVHLQIGALTLNLAPDAFAQMAVMVRDAMVELNALYTSNEAAAEMSLAEASGWKH